MTLAIVVFSIGLISSFQQVRDLDGEVNGRIRNSMWILSQLETEHLRFIQSLDSYVFGVNGVSHDDLVLRMDIFWSRLPLLIEGLDSRQINKIVDVKDTAKKSLETLQRIEPVIQALKPGLSKSYQFARQELVTLTPMIHQALLSTSYLNDEGGIGMRDDRMEGVLKQGLISFIGVILFGGVLMFMQFSEVNKRRKLEDELRGLATADALTGTNNRRHYLELSEMEIHRLRRHNRPLSVLMMDLDRFKSINDTYGHAVGDEVLRRFVEICSRILRQEDIMGRLGGEEFAVTLPEESAETASITAERLCRNFEMESVPVEGGEVRVTVSIGVAELTDADETFEDCLYRADTALYVAKNAGRNRVELA